MWRQPSPAAAPALCQDDWPVCSPSVCLVQCHCVLYLQAGIDGRNACCYSCQLFEQYHTYVAIFIRNYVGLSQIKTFLFVQFVIKCDFQVLKPGPPV